jgi:hypothetical protein
VGPGSISSATGADFGVCDDTLYRSILKARFLSRRYIVLDLLDACGLLKQTAMAPLSK